MLEKIKMNKLIFILFITLVSCSNSKENNKLQEVFTESEIQDLKKITSFFESQICLNSNSNFKSCFEELLPELINEGWTPILERVDFEKQIKMYHSLNESTFNEIWQFDKSSDLKGNYSKNISPSIKVNINSF